MQNKETVWHPDAAQREKIRAFLDQLQAEKGEKGRGYELIMQGIALQFAGYLVREGMLDWHGGEPTADIGPDLERIVHYIEENYMQDINLEKVAEELHMNYSYASRYFRKMTGKILRNSWISSAFQKPAECFRTGERALPKSRRRAVSPVRRR